MKHILRLFSLILWCFSELDAQDTFKLAMPYLEYESVFFEKKCKVSMKFAEAGTHIHYTTDGKVPTIESAVYKAPIFIKKSKILKAKVFGDGYLPSEVTEVAFFKGGLSIDSISHDAPNAKYSGNGSRTLVDNQGGNTRFSAKTWLGFNEKVVTMELLLSKPQEVNQLMIHALKNQNAWIFLPQKIEVFADTQGSDELVLQGTQTINDTLKDLRMETHALWLALPQPIETKRVVVKIYPLMEIPNWHPGMGARSWLFIDEIKIY